ncbi:MAG: ferredoxin [Proteobacteria bacterium]|nr:ferredoxin [Pseudomonadota bacterium]
MYVILTSKPGRFRTELVPGLRPLEAYDYMFYGRHEARFVIAELVDTAVRIRVVEEESGIVNEVPSKFLEKFETAEGALDGLRQLVTFGRMETSLRKAAAP